MINSSPSHPSPGTDSSKRIRLTIPRNSKSELIHNSNTVSPHKLDDILHKQKQSIDCNNTMTTMKQQLSSSIDNENDTTLLTTTTTTTTVEVKVKTTKTSSSSSRKRKLNIADDTSNSNDDNTTKQEQQEQQQQQSVSKKKVIYLSTMQNTIEARKTERKFNLYFSYKRARASAASPRDNDILMCACMRVRSPYLLFSFHT